MRVTGWPPVHVDRYRTRTVFVVLTRDARARTGLNPPLCFSSLCGREDPGRGTNRSALTSSTTNPQVELIRVTPLRYTHLLAVVLDRTGESTNPSLGGFVCLCQSLFANSPRSVQHDLATLRIQFPPHAAGLDRRTFEQICRYTTERRLASGTSIKRRADTCSLI